MGLKIKNADDLVQHYGTRDATGEHTLGIEKARGYVEIFDDFVYSGAFEAASPWVINSDTSATDAAVVAGGIGGVVRLTTGSADNEGSQIVGQAGATANQGGLVMEAKVQLSAITTTAVFVGFTDVTTIEEPALIDASDAVTSTATDLVGFMFDTDAGTDEWFVVATPDSHTTAATGQGACGTAPTAATYQTLRVEVSADGAGAKFFIDGAKVGETTANTVSADAVLYPTIVSHNRTTASRNIDVDYVHVAHNR